MLVLSLSLAFSLPLSLGCGLFAADKDDDDDTNGTTPSWFGDSGDADTDSDSDGDSDSDSDVDSDTDSDCSTVIESTFPVDGSRDAYYRGSIEFELSGEDPSAEVEAPVDGTQSLRGERTVVFTPDEPLEPDTDYAFTLRYCGGSGETEFRTSEIGTPLDAADDLVGATFAIDLSAGRWVEPAGVGSLLAQYVTTDPLMGVIDVRGDELDLLSATAREDSDPPVQDFCNATLVPDSADFSDAPYFEITEDETVVGIAGVALSVWNLEISGAFAPDGNSIAGIEFAGIFDSRAMDALMGEDREEGEICRLVPSFGVECEECPDGSGEFCLPVRLDSATGEVVNRLTLVEIDGYECEGCEDWTAADVPDADDRVCEDEPTGSSGACAVVSAVNIGAIALSLLAVRRRRGQFQGSAF